MPMPTMTPSASASAESSNAAPVNKRESHVQKALEVAKAEPDEDARGRQAMRGLSQTEKSHLPAPVLQLLDLAAEKGTSSADFNTKVLDIVSRPPLSEGLEDLCGRPASTVLADLQKTDVKKRSEKLYADCKLGRRIKFAENDLARLAPSSVLLVLVAREFLAKHDAIVEPHEEMVKLAIYAFAQKK